ncbi:hypothetical protein Q787_10960 [Ornithobacterium rhinotracheale H06-030791]|nr:hypothetical protein [Ornithobacterium rhinotracheale]KGB65837.1 hypothetical protein Q787_10960 [Ornithobacterium rhinotracheale H06-030791]
MPTLQTSKRHQTLRLYACVREEYARLSNITAYGKQKYTHEYIISELAQKFFRSERTIENIIFNRV